MEPRVLLLQARRPGDEERARERVIFARATGLPLDRIVVHDLTVSVPSLSEVRHYDTLMMGGAGEYNVSRGELPTHERLLDLLREIAEIGFPVFASCFGFQCLARALGGEVVFDPDSTEIGTYELELTAAGREDPILGALPPRFQAQLGRKERVARTPSEVSTLAASAANPVQALRVRDQPIWATQFHPELDARENRRRYVRYAEIYSGFLSREARRRALERFTESPDTARLLPRFLEVALGFPGNGDRTPS